MATPRLRKVSSKREMESLIDDYITQGYEVISEGDSTTLLRKKSWGTTSGHLICLLATVWFTFGIGNAIYAIVAHNGAEKVLLKLPDQIE